MARVATSLGRASRQDFLGAVRHLADTAAGEDGVLDYSVAEDVHALGWFTFVERYRDASTLERHQATLACQAYVAGLPAWLAEPAVVHVEQATWLEEIPITQA